MSSGLFFLLETVCQSCDICGTNKSVLSALLNLLYTFFTLGLIVFARLPHAD